MRRRLVQATANLPGLSAGTHVWVDAENPRVAKLMAGGWLVLSGYDSIVEAPASPEPEQSAGDDDSDVQGVLEDG